MPITWKGLGLQKVSVKSSLPKRQLFKKVVIYASCVSPEIAQVKMSLMKYFPVVIERGPNCIVVQVYVGGDVKKNTVYKLPDPREWNASKIVSEFWVMYKRFSRERALY